MGAGYHPPGALSDIIGDADLSGYEWRWELRPTGDGATEVTQTYDWSGVNDPNAIELFPRVSEAQMSATIERLNEALT